jgi:Family of unknown function (DUF6356)
LLRQAFLEHPKSVGETYLVHQRQAFGFGLSMIAGGLACLVHGLVPSMFLHTGSETISRLHTRMAVRRTPADKHAVLANRA